MRNKLAWLEAALVVAPFAALLALWDRLPARIPMHWNLTGDADRWSSSRWEVLLLPLFSLGAVVVCRVLPRLDPKLRQMSDTGRMPTALQVLRIAMACLFGAIFALQIAAALGSAMPIGRIATVGILLFLAVTGNYLGNLRQNYFFGLRTPWTLEDEETWRATHRRGGELLFFGSSALLLLSFIVSQEVFVPLLVAAVAAFILWTLLFSWHHYHRRRYSGRAA